MNARCPSLLLWNGRAENADCWVAYGVFTRSIFRWGFLFLYRFSSPKIELRLPGIGFGLLFAWAFVLFPLRIKHTGVEAENHARGPKELRWS
jgi:hypothetical protein